MKDNFSHEVERKNKCIFICGNTARVNTDIVPCFAFKRFQTPYHVVAEGIRLFSDDGKTISSYPKQHYDNGARKNNATNTNYKSAVRILKNTRNSLIEDGIIDENIMPSFFLECLVWNLPNTVFDQSSHADLVNAVMKTLWEDMHNFDQSNNYAEVSDLMWLFRGQTERTPEKAIIFLNNAYSLIND